MLVLSVKYRIFSLEIITLAYGAQAITVPDHASRIRDVVLVRLIFSPGNPRGSGIWDGEGNGEGMEMGRSVYEQPGTKVDGILSPQGGFPSK